MLCCLLRLKGKVYAKVKRTNDQAQSVVEVLGRKPDCKLNASEEKIFEDEVLSASSGSVAHTKRASSSYHPNQSSSKLSVQELALELAKTHSFGNQIPCMKAVIR
ncbi:hypothetical protein ACROYT_G021576 [Oculina patagonica]